MNTIDAKRLTILGFGLVFFAVWLLWAGKHTTQHSTNQTVYKATEKPKMLTIRKQSKAVRPLLSVKPSIPPKKSRLARTTPVEKNLGINTYWEPTEILQETYAEDEFLDEYLDEAAYIEQQQRRFESMSDEEWATKDQINTLENQLMMQMDDFGQHDDVTRQLVELFVGDDEQSNTLRDLRCAQGLCRMVLELADETEQYEILDALPDQIDWLQQSYAKVQIQPDNSRLVTVYLMRPEMTDDLGMEPETFDSNPIGA